MTNTILTKEQIDACWDGLMPSGCGKSRYDTSDLLIAAVLSALVQRAPVEAVACYAGHRLTPAGTKAVSYTHLTLPTSDLV